MVDGSGLASFSWLEGGGGGRARDGLCEILNSNSDLPKKADETTLKKAN